MIQPLTDEDSPSIRRAAYRAWVQEMEWSHPRRGDSDDLQACADPKCRFCRNVRGEVRDGFSCEMDSPADLPLTDEELARSVITNELANGALKDWSMSRCAEVAADIIGALDAAEVGIADLLAARARVVELTEQANEAARLLARIGAHREEAIAEVEQLKTHVQKLQNAVAALVTVVPGAKSGLDPE